MTNHDVDSVIEVLLGLATMVIVVGMSVMILLGMW